MYPEPDKLAKQFKYAASREVRFVVVIGEAEVARNEVAVKDMRSGEQRSVGRKEMAQIILAAREKDW